jgi:DNA-binding LacI/PurR family transcriptional regulator
MLAALALYRKSIAPVTVGASVAWINCWENPQKLRSFKEYDGYWRGASETGERWGYRLDEFVVNEQLSLKRLRTILRTRNVQGILLPPHPGEVDWGEFPWEEFSIVRFGRSLAEPRTHMVSSDQVGDSALAGQKMRELGYDRIGFVGDRGLGRDWERQPRFLAGFQLWQTQIPEALRIPPLGLKRKDPREDLEHLVAWLQLHRPDAILTEVSETKPMLEAAGLRIPQDIGIAATSILDGNADAGIFQNPEAIGKAAMEVLIALINRNERGIPSVSRSTNLEGTWVNGTTLPSRAKPAKKQAKAR